MAEPTKFTGAEFAKKMRSGDFTSNVSFRGMTKESESDDEILFSPHADCSNWVKIPVDQIENVDLITTVSCKDHRHAFVELTLKKPVSADALTFSAIAAAQAEGFAKSQQAASAPNPLSVAPRTSCGLGARSANNSTGCECTPGTGDWYQCDHDCCLYGYSAYRVPSMTNRGVY